MPISMAHSLWLRQTVYTVVVVVLVTTVTACIEIFNSYQNEHQRHKQFGIDLIESFSDTAARAAFHVDKLQAQTVVDGVMQYALFDEVRISTELGTVLARQSRETKPSTIDYASEWLFSDVTSFKRELIVDRANFISGGQLQAAGGKVKVGEIEIHANASVIGHSFIKGVIERVRDLLIESLVLAAALAFIFHRSITKPLASVAEQLGATNPRGGSLANLQTPANQEHNEIGLVVARTNELLNQIDEQQEEMLQREKVAALGSMLAEVAHELNNPLAVVTAQAELLAETALDTKTQERAQKILRPAMRCAGIVRKFLTLTRQRKIEKSALDAEILINESIELLSYQLSKSEIKVCTDIPTDLIKIWGDGAQLSQVLINLVINSQQALMTVKGDREITISARSDAEDHRVCISVIDNGPGIAPEIREKVFKPFFTTKPLDRGTGLGLSFCRSVVQAHGGKISLRDVEPHGTEVVVEVPGTTSAASIEPVRTQSGRTSTTAHVLVVDDEESLAASISDVLIRYGHTAVTAFSAEQAMGVLRSENFDTIIADIHMPGTNGMEFYRNACALNSTLAEKFIFITGDALDQTVRQFFAVENRPHLNKPFEISELIDAIESLISRENLAGQANSDSGGSSSV
ncbi:MAG: hybrid sensor histidine kinase/response regulator [Halioglobus sp.]